MKRRRARELILRVLFQKDFVECPEGWSQVPDAYAREVLQGIEEHRAEIDQLIAERAQGWRLERLHSVDRNLLRMAIYELLYRDDVPPEVVIDEAVELAKKYGAEKSPAFINGILDRILKERSAS
jgi:N utilization substance protein B